MHNILTTLWYLYFPYTLIWIIMLKCDYANVFQMIVNYICFHLKWFWCHWTLYEHWTRETFLALLAFWQRPCYHSNIEVVQLQLLYKTHLWREGPHVSAATTLQTQISSGKEHRARGSKQLDTTQPILMDWNNLWSFYHEQNPIFKWCSVLVVLFLSADELLLF